MTAAEGLQFALFELLATLDRLKEIPQGHDVSDLLAEAATYAQVVSVLRTVRS